MQAIEHEGLARSLATSGLRMTRQRQQVFDVVAESHDHPTAEEVFKRARRAAPGISFATVYNCLNALVQCGLVRQVVLDRSPARFCPNMRQHWHFCCEACGEVLDVDVDERESSSLAGAKLPRDFKVSHVDVALRGRCSKCAGKSVDEQRREREG